MFTIIVVAKKRTKFMWLFIRTYINMKLEDQILVNGFGQGLIAIDQLTTGFRLLELMTKKEFLSELRFLIMQSKPEEGDIEPAIIKSDLNSTFTPCVLLKRGVQTII